MKSLWIGFIACVFNTANAQEVKDTYDFELFRPPADHYGYFAVPSAATLGHLQLGGGFTVNYENDPIILVSEGVRYAPPLANVEGDNGEGIVDDRLTGNVQLGLGVSRYFSLTVDVPLIMWQDGYLPNAKVLSNDNPPDRLITSGIGDVRAIPKVIALDRDRMPIGMAIAIPVGIPTGNGGSFLGEERVSLTPSTIFEFSDGPIRSRKYSFRSSVMAGFHVRPPAEIRNVPVNNGMVYGLAMGLHASVMEIIGEFHGEVWGERAAQQPAEVLGGIKLLAGDYVSIVGHPQTGARGALVQVDLEQQTNESSVEFSVQLEAGLKVGNGSGAPPIFGVSGLLQRAGDSYLELATYQEWFPLPAVSIPKLNGTLFLSAEHS